MRSGKSIALVVMIFAALIAGLSGGTSFAQDGTSVETEASPAAQPPAQTATQEESFVGASFRVGVVAAQRSPAIPDLELAEKATKDWIVLVADVTNWSTKNATLTVKDFGILFTGSEKAGGFAAASTKKVAATLETEPKNVNAGVKVGKGDTVRVSLVFQVNSDDVNPTLAFEGKTLPLDPSISAGVSLEALPDVIIPAELETADVKDASDGGTLILDDDSEVKLTSVEPPLPEECFGGQSTSRLKKLAGEEVLLERQPDGTAYVWAEQSNGSRRLINYELISTGFTTLQAGSTGIFASWMANGLQIAQTNLAGIWGGCTSAHGVAKNQGSERTPLTILSGDTPSPYLVWGIQSWNPTIVTTPDGGAWAFFSAQASDGDEKDLGRLYGSQLDPSTGTWSAAVSFPGGDLEFSPDAVVDSHGLVHLVYADREKDDPADFAVLMYTHEQTDGTWTDPIAVAPSNEAGHQIAPSLAIGKDDTLYVAWQDQRLFSDQARTASALNADIFVSQMPAGGEWSEPKEINPHVQTAAGSRPQLVIDGDRLVAVWSVYTSATGATNAARLDWSTRPVADPDAWAAPQPLVVGRGEKFGGRNVDLAADPNGGVIVVYSRQVNDTFLFARRLAPDATEWGGDVLITAGNRGTAPSVTVSNQGVVYITYNVGSGDVVDVGAVAIPFRSIQPGPEKVMTQDDPNTQGISTVTTDVTGTPWVIYFSESPGSPPDKVFVLRNAAIPSK